uniref:Death domain-containing protein n=1 Tax=Amphimedon queenslandica TaxID=400682 RepID=A0A1X7TAK0_AMPQE
MHGAPGAGKTCSQHLLLNEPPPSSTDSTAIACRAVQATRISVDDKNKKWERVKREDFLNQLASHLEEARNETKQKEASIKMDEKRRNLGVVLDASDLPLNEAAKNMEVIIKIANALATGKSQKLTSNWVYFIDSGGQPAYRELLPLFTRAAALNIITIDLTKDLDEKCKFQYRISQCTSPINTNLQYSNRGIIRSTISSEAMLNLIEIPYVSHMPKHSHYLILGTRKDDESVTEKKLEEMNESLMKSSNLALKNIIWNMPQESIIFPVNTLLPAGSKEREEASVELCTAISNCNLEMTIELPIRLFIFEISLQIEAKSKERNFLTREEVNKIGAEASLKGQGPPTTKCGVQHTELNTSNLIHVLDILKKHRYSGVDYYYLGLRLGLLPGTLDVIEEESKGNVRKGLRKCLTAWLEQADDVKSVGGPTYDTLIQALRDEEAIAVADGIEKGINRAEVSFKSIPATRPTMQPTELNELKSVHVAAKNSFLIHGKSTQSLNWEEYGIRITIPQGAVLPSDTVQVTITALVGGDFIFPEDTELVRQACIDEYGSMSPPHFPESLITISATPGEGAVKELSYPVTLQGITESDIEKINIVLTIGDFQQAFAGSIASNAGPLSPDDEEWKLAGKVLRENSDKFLKILAAPNNLSAVIMSFYAKELISDATVTECMNDGRPVHDRCASLLFALKATIDGKPQAMNTLIENEFHIYITEPPTKGKVVNPAAAVLVTTGPSPQVLLKTTLGDIDIELWSKLRGSSGL